MSDKPKNPTRSRRIPRAAERLLDLAWEVANRLQQKAPYHRQERKLSDLVERVLEQGDRQALQEAFERLDHANREDALQILSYWVIHHASVLKATFQTAAGETNAQIHVFLLPILFVVPIGTAVPSAVPASPDLPRQSPLHSLVTSFRRHGLVVGDCSVLVVPDLYSVPELPQDAFAWRQRLHRFETLLQGHSEPLIRSTPEGEKVSDAPQQGFSWVLRYVQMAVVTDEDHPDPGPLITGELALCTFDEEALDDADRTRTEVWKRQVESWHEEIVSKLGAAWDSEVSLSVGVPAVYDEALTAGQTMANSEQLAHTAEALLEEGVPHLQAVIGAFYGADTELRVGLHGSVGLYYGTAWTCVGDVDLEMEEAEEILRNNGITEITVLPIPYDEGRDPSTGEKLYPTASGRLVRWGEPVTDDPDPGSAASFPVGPITYH
jgi:hypothetical protein